jgi:dCMP deaminase
MIHIPRLPWEQYFMLHAHLTATRSTCDRGPELLLDPGRHGVGAVFVRNRRIIAGGYNGSPPGQPHCDEFRCKKCTGTGPTAEEVQHEDVRHHQPEEWLEGPPPLTHWVEGGHIMVDGHCVRTLHAEENGLIQCALDGVSPVGCEVFTTASPCWDCAKRLIRAGVYRVWFGNDYDSRYGMSNKVGALLVDSGVRIGTIKLKRSDFYMEEERRGPTF